MSKVWFITGASRGLGLEVARAVLDAGHRVVATARRPEQITSELAGYGERLLALPLDVTNTEQATAAVGLARDSFGGIDVLVNNAGYGHLGWFENSTDAEVRQQFEVNLFGAMNVTRAVLPLMRERRAGHVITISSVAGLVAVAGASIYAGSKFAVEGWMEGLAGELKPLGIHATIIEPGFFRTDFLDGSSATFPASRVPDYAEAQQQFISWHEDMNHQQVGDPAKMGGLLLKVVAMDEPPVRLAAGSDGAQWAMSKGDLLSGEAKKWLQLSATTDRDGVSEADLQLPSDY
jgi:NAD(P)-dependent dehydrogenase (short-subunit alcohol dehydrogenase family)